MTSAAASMYSSQVHSSQGEHRDKSMQFLAKSNTDFRQKSRREDSELLYRAFPARTQKEISEKASRAIGVSPRQIIYWMQCENDMPSWAVKAVKHYVRVIESTALKIERRE